MSNLIYAAIASLDGFVEDDQGQFAWAEPDQEVLSFVNHLERPIGTYLYGRRMYETMLSWETAPEDASRPLDREFAAIWQKADKIVYSRTLEYVSSTRTRLERAFEPEVVRRLKSSSRLDITVGGPELAGQALAAGLVDELHLFVVPVVVGAGKRWLPDAAHLDLELLGTRRFAGGVTYARYRSTSP